MCSIYLEYQSNVRLKKFVACYWSLQTFDFNVSHSCQVMSYGCADFIFDKTGNGVIVGNMTKAVAVSNVNSNSMLYFDIYSCFGD